MQSKQSMQSHRTSLTAFEARPWPAAMLYGHIRNMKHAGDRAKAYARGVNELARADTGLMEWCAMASTSIRILIQLRFGGHLDTSDPRFCGVRVCGARRAVC